MRYEAYGPFSAPRVQPVPNAAILGCFWNKIEKEHPGLSSAIGIYIFSTRHGAKYTPWYVGKTNAEKGFRGEVFQSHKLNHYVTAGESKRGAPTIHLIAKIEPERGNFCRSSVRSGREIDELETVMIGMAWRANPCVQNSKKTWFNKNCIVPGIIGAPLSGRPPSSVSTLRSVLACAR